MRPQRVVVTGSGGVLGAGFLAVAGDYPQHDFVFARQADCNLCDLAATQAYVRRVAPAAILHLAAVSGGVTLSRNRPATLLRDNLWMTLNVLEAARRLRIQKVVMTLSCGMYPPAAPLPWQESSIHAGPAHRSNYSYAYAKRLIEPALRAYRAEFGLNVIGLVPSAIFGPGDKFSDASATFIAALLKRFYDHRDDDTPLVVWGDGSARREMTFNEDLARAFLWCLEHYHEADILNVGSADEYSIREIALLIAEALAIDPRRITFDPSKPGGVPRQGMDHSKFQALSRFQYTPFREGLRRTIQWLHDREAAAPSPR